MSCPATIDLAATDAEETLSEHLRGCRRCRALLARLQSHEDTLEHTSAPAGPQAPPTRPLGSGGVWSFWAPGSEEYLVAAVLDADEVELLIVPLLADTRWASENDIDVPIGTLGYPALAPVWAGDHVLAEQAVEPLSVLSELELEQLSDGYDAIYAGAAIAEPAGPAVIGPEDPRIAAHAAIADQLRAYFAPWSALQGAEELGPVLKARREDAELPLEAWAERIDVEPEVWQRFESAQLDPYTVIPVGAIAAATRELGLLASQRIISLAHASVKAHHSGQATHAAPARARRRRGVAPRARRDPDVAREAADRYAAALAKELGL
jgi:hypothetical protein